MIWKREREGIKSVEGPYIPWVWRRAWGRKNALGIQDFDDKSSEAEAEAGSCLGECERQKG